MIYKAKPYEVKEHFPFGYCIFFDVTTNLGWYLYKKDADTICAQLNGAYRLGYYKGLSETEYDD